MKVPTATMLALAALALPVAGCASDPMVLAQATPPAAAQKHRVVIQVSDPDPRLWAQALNNAENLQKVYGAGNVEVEIVALGLGIGILKLDSPQAHRIPDALKHGVRIDACEMTMGKQKLKREDMLPGIQYVPGGLVRIIELQQAGWNYIKG